MSNTKRKPTKNEVLAQPENPIIELTQGHLEDWHEAFRTLMTAADQRWGENLAFEHAKLGVEIQLGPPAEYAEKFYARFLSMIVEANRDFLSKTEQYGWMIRAAISSGWLVFPAWQIEEVRKLSPSTIAWVGQKLDEVYSDYEFATDRARAEAARQAGWLNGAGDVAIDTLPDEAVERLAEQVKTAYRIATEIPPE